jgi:hypothetical protein
MTELMKSLSEWRYFAFLVMLAVLAGCGKSHDGPKARDEKEEPQIMQDGKEEWFLVRKNRIVLSARETAGDGTVMAGTDHLRLTVSSDNSLVNVRVSLVNPEGNDTVLVQRERIKQDVIEIALPELRQVQCAFTSPHDNASIEYKLETRIAARLTTGELAGNPRVEWDPKLDPEVVLSDSTKIDADHLTFSFFHAQTASL